MNRTLEDNPALKQAFNQVVYTDGVMQRIEGGIDGKGFFPGASGIIDQDKRLSDCEFLVLGQDQDTLSGYNKSCKKGHEEYTPTWRKMEKLFETSGIEMHECFFTNLLMGVRLGKGKNTGRSPGFSHSKFVETCLEVLKVAMEIQKPKALICLGMIPLQVLKYFSKELHQRLILIDRYQELDNNKLGLIKDVKFDIDSTPKIHVATIVHPSYRHLNFGYRKFNGKEGDEAEKELLKGLN